MGSAIKMISSVGLGLLCFLWLVDWTSALVIPIPGMGDHAGALTSPKEVSSQTTSRPSDTIHFRIRSTTEADLDQVSHLLASALGETSTSHHSHPVASWKSHMDYLKRKSSIHNVLKARLQALRHGRIIRRSLEDKSLSERDQLRVLWSHDAFRRAVRIACQQSTEPHAWKSHNFDLTPLSSNWLQHKMITAVEADSNNVLGFCEVAMIQDPLSNTEEDIDHQPGQESFRPATPTIANLVTDRRHRNRGIGSSLLQSACTYVQRYWPAEEHLALYVDDANRKAVSVYRRFGFQTAATAGDEQNCQLYMTKKLADSSSRNEARKLDRMEEGRLVAI